MRARMAVCVSGVSIKLIEVDLKNKPVDMLRLSPKGTVPVLKLPDGTILEQSIDIMHWALTQADPQGWLLLTPQERMEAETIVATNDGPFKQWLDRYKYHIRFPEENASTYRDQAMDLLQSLTRRLDENGYLFGPRIKWPDVAVFPFIRQLAHVDLEWFNRHASPSLVRWLSGFTQSDLFASVMDKSQRWASHN